MLENYRGLKLVIGQVVLDFKVKEFYFNNFRSFEKN